MCAKDDTTERLEQSEPGRDPRTVQAIRWLDSRSVRPTRLDRNRLTLGRGGSADVELDVAGVSREHAVLTRQGPVYAIADAKSTNGTFVNGVRIEHAALAPNDVVRLGDLVGVVVRAPADDTGESDVRVVGDALFGPGLAAVRGILDQCARSPLPMVLIGETGVGKEAVARALHARSGRDGPFHAVNCAALPASLAEAELFGYRKGAFTGAEQAGIGHLRAADGGTLLLDELADLALPAQAKLLRALQDSQVTPLGETKAISVNVRIMAACQAPLLELVATGRLREDLMMRLNGFTLTLPPLRERRVDVGLLFRHFVDRFFATELEIEPRALEQVLLAAWPGNVRELELFTRRLLTLQKGATRLRRSMLPDSMKSPSDSNPPPRDDAASPLDRREHDLIGLCRELEKNGGSVAAAAAAIGISRQRAYRLMDKKSVEELLAIAKKKPGA